MKFNTNDILKEVASKLKNERCTKCLKTAIITVKNESISTETCCEDFEKKLKIKAEKFIKEISEKLINEDINDMLGKAFKRL